MPTGRFAIEHSRNTDFLEQQGKGNHAHNHETQVCPMQRVGISYKQISFSEM